MKCDRYQCIDHLVRTHIEQRGLGSVDSLEALKDAGKQLAESRSVLIITGFPVRGEKAGETDGPIGALSLAHALERLGKQVAILTDRYSCTLIASGIAMLGLDCGLHCLPRKFAKRDAVRILDRFKPSHLVSIERPGRAGDGRLYSMRGEDLSDLIPGVDELFEVASKRKIVTIAIGDGGNELGMGRVADIVADCVNHGKTIANRTAADHLIVAGVSNWGAHGLVAAMSVITRVCLLYEPDREWALLKELVDHGAVDGVTHRNEMSVDGHDALENLRMFESFLKIIHTGIDSVGAIH